MSPPAYTVAYFNRNYADTEFLSMELAIAESNLDIVEAKRTERLDYLDDGDRLARWVAGARDTIEGRREEKEIIPEFTISRFTRLGRPVTMLRDSKGRFARKVK